MSVRDRERTTVVDEPTSSAATVLGRQTATAAERMRPLARGVFADGAPVQFRFWDGSALGPKTGPGAVVFRSSRALTHLVWSPDEIGIARAFISGEIDLEGDAFAVLRDLQTGARSGRRRLGIRAVASGLRAAWRLGALGLPPSRPSEEARLGGWRHSRYRDAAAISHHYDVGNDFYRLVLGPAMTYSCARFEEPATTLEQAQQSKHELICRKLGLHERANARLLDVGCGWGSMAMHAAAEHGAHVVGITLSQEQVERARARVREAGLDGLVEIRLQDYRELHGEYFDAISSIGMFEHVGAKRMDEYFETLAALLKPTGRLLNHAISAPGGSRLHGRTFMNRYVFPDGELIDIAKVVAAMERAGFEVRDLESLREHYSQTLHAWVDNLENSWEEAVGLVGEARARIWRLYMTASANGFDDGGLAVHQALGVRPEAGGSSGMPRTRDGWQ
jgi:cyclopropane-fatty-acyl-phospholipid synthase